jgi:hypothetical protein
VLLLKPEIDGERENTVFVFFDNFNAGSSDQDLKHSDRECVSVTNKNSTTICDDVCDCHSVRK